jgi:hypothetical protein
MSAVNNHGDPSYIPFFSKRWFNDRRVVAGFGA